MRTRGVRSSCAHVALIAVVAGGGACTERTAAPIDAQASMLTWERPLVLPDPRVAQFVDFDPLTIRERRGGFAALDRYAQQLVLFDSAFHVVGRRGRRGGGPGELDGVIRLERWRHGLAIGEGRNARLSLFNDDGDFRGLGGSRYYGTPFAIRDDRTFATPSQLTTALAEMASLDERTRRTIGMRPPATDPADDRFVGLDLVAYRPDRTLLVLDNRNGSLHAVRDDGQMTAQWHFPAEWLTSLRSRRSARVSTVEAIAGARVHGAPLFKDLSVTGRLALILQPLAPHCVLLVDLSESTVVPLHASTPDLHDALCRAESAVLTQRDLVVAVNDSLLQFVSPFRAQPTVR